MTQSSASVPVSGFSEPKATTPKVSGYIVIDAQQNAWGPFSSNKQAIYYAQFNWPNDSKWDVWPIHEPMD